MICLHIVHKYYTASMLSIIKSIIFTFIAWDALQGAWVSFKKDVEIYAWYINIQLYTPSHTRKNTQKKSAGFYERLNEPSVMLQCQPQESQERAGLNVSAIMKHFDYLFISSVLASHQNSGFLSILSVPRASFSWKPI